jgi:hypothetical protein
LQAGGRWLGSRGAGGRVEAQAVVRADPVELVAPGLSTPGENPPSWGRLYPLARIIQRKFRRFFKYLIIDEAAQSMAAGKLIGSTDHVLALTRTLSWGRHRCKATWWGSFSTYGFFSSFPIRALLGSSLLRQFAASSVLLVAS